MSSGSPKSPSPDDSVRPETPAQGAANQASGLGQPPAATPPVEDSASAAATPAGPGAAPAESATPAADESPPGKKSSIKIGSQRHKVGERAPDRAIRLTTPPAALAANPAEAANPTEAAATSPNAAAEIPSPVSETAVSPDAAPESPAAAEPVLSEATNVELSPDAVDNVAADINFPPPRPMRLPEDVEKEIEEALAGASIEDLLGGEKLGSEELEIDSRRAGVVVKSDQEYVFVSLGAEHEGALAIKNLEDVPQAGAEIEVVITGYNAADGLYELALPGAAVEVSDWSDIAEGAVVKANINGSNKGGLECQVNNIRGFIPAGQISVHRVEDFSEYIGQQLLCVVMEANPSRKNLVLSHRAIMEREREAAKEALMASLEVGQIHEGVVRSIKDFGAFVDIGGVDGLIHISQLSWDRVKHPSDVLQEGETVKVKVEKIDTETGRIGFSYRDSQDNPWTNIDQKYTPSSIVKGVVTRTAKFGAFVKLEPGVEGLIHVSELAHHRVTQVENVVQEGQEVEVQVMSVDPQEQRIGLSLKATLQAPAPAGKSKQAEEDEPPREPVIPRPEGPLRGGTGEGSGGDAFGLNW